MADGDALGTAGGARGVDDVGEVLGRRARRRRGGRERRSLGLEGGQQLGIEDEGGAAVGDHPASALLGIGGIDGDVDAARAKNGELGDHERR